MFELPFCTQCGKPSKGPACDECGVAVAYDAAGDIVSLCLTVIFKCKFCGDSVPLSGLVASYACGGCKKVDAIAPRTWAELLATSARGFARVGAPYDVERTRAAAYCECGARFPLQEMPLGASTNTRCACGCGLRATTAPPWLLDVLPCARGTYEVVKAQIPNTAHEPVMMICPRCGAGLELTFESERVTRCVHCQVNVFLPAELWERFHPKTAAARWFFVYVAPIMTARELADGVVIRRRDD